MLRIKNIALLVLLGFLLTGCKQETQEVVQEKLLIPEQAEYKTAAVKVGDHITESSMSGGLYFPVSAPLMLEEASSAKIKEIYVKEGDRVKAGDILATFELEDRRLELNELELTLLRAQQDFERGKSDRQIYIEEAIENLDKVTEHRDTQMALLRIEKQKVALEQYIYETNNYIDGINEQISEIKESLTEDELVAPFDGIIYQVFMNREGDTVYKGQWLITMYSPDHIMVKVSDNDRNNLRYYADVSVESGKKGKKEYPGKVLCTPVILPETVSCDYALVGITEDVTVDDFGSMIKINAITQEIRNVIVIDKSHYQKEEGKSFVYLMEDGVLKKRFISEGSNNRQTVWVFDGLMEGQTLVID